MWNQETAKKKTIKYGVVSLTQLLAENDVMTFMFKMMSCAPN